MPINYLKPISEKSEAVNTIEYIQQVYKRPFSLRALLISLGLGLVVAILTTGILLLVQTLTQKPVRPAQITDTAEDFVISPDYQTLGDAVVDVSKLDSDGDSIPDWRESFYQTDPFRLDTDFDGYDDWGELVNGFDPTGFGRPATKIIIEKIALTAPVIYPMTILEVDIQAAMAKGVAHYPGSAMPGMDGNIYITGHSSDYTWNPGDFKRVFRQLNELAPGDLIILEQHLNNGHLLSYKYEVYDKQVAEVNEAKIWQSDKDGSVLTLVTSWPLDSTKQRLMVRAGLLE